MKKILLRYVYRLHCFCLILFYSPRKKRLSGKNIEGIYCVKNGKRFLLVKNKKVGSSWKAGEAEDEIDLEEQINDYIKTLFPVKKVTADYVGFLSLFKKEYMIFKVKNMTQKGTEGARCDQAKKQDIISYINSIMEYDVYESTVSVSRKVLCIILEFVLRYANKNKLNNKIWFMTPVEVILTNIEKV